MTTKTEYKVWVHSYFVEKKKGTYKIIGTCPTLQEACSLLNKQNLKSTEKIDQTAEIQICQNTKHGYFETPLNH